jgi:hypothetical protein
MDKCENDRGISICNKWTSPWRCHEANTTLGLVDTNNTWGDGTRTDVTTARDPCCCFVYSHTLFLDQDYYGDKVRIRFRFAPRGGGPYNISAYTSPDNSAWTYLKSWTGSPAVDTDIDMDAKLPDTKVRYIKLLSNVTGPSGQGGIMDYMRVIKM